MRMIENFRKFPTSILILHVSAKFLFGVGLGALLATYLCQCNWQLYGWVMIVISLIIGIPGAYLALKK